MPVMCLAAPRDSTTSFRSPDQAYYLVLAPDSTEDGSARGSCTLLDSTGTVVWKKKWLCTNGRDVIAISNRGAVAVLGKLLSSSIACGPGVTRETEGPTRLHAEVYDRNGDLIRTWMSNPYSRHEEVREYVHCLAFHPGRELLVIGIKSASSSFDWGSHVYGVTLDTSLQWQLELDRGMDPTALEFRGEDIVVRCHSPRASADSVLVLTPYGELKPQ
jgi:hypothetical protein